MEYRKKHHRAICIRLGHESLDVTLAYFKGKDVSLKKPRNM